MVSSRIQTSGLNRHEIILPVFVTEQPHVHEYGIPVDLKTVCLFQKRLVVLHILPADEIRRLKQSSHRLNALKRNRAPAQLSHLVIHLLPCRKLIRRGIVDKPVKQLRHLLTGHSRLSQILHRHAQLRGVAQLLALRFRHVHGSNQFLHSLRNLSFLRKRTDAQQTHQHRHSDQEQLFH